MSFLKQKLYRYCFSLTPVFRHFYGFFSFVWPPWGFVEWPREYQPRKTSSTERPRPVHSSSHLRKYEETKMHVRSMFKKYSLAYFIRYIPCTSRGIFRGFRLRWLGRYISTVSHSQWLAISCPTGHSTVQYDQLEILFFLLYIYYSFEKNQFHNQGHWRTNII